MLAFVNKYPWLLNILPTKDREQVKKSLTKSDKYLSFILRRFCKQYHYPEIGKGAFRTVYDTNIGWVIKFPQDAEGIECNLVEANMYKAFKNTGHYAKCYIKFYQGIPLLVMEHVKDYFSIKDKIPFGLLPAWIHHTDGPQIGYNENGKLRIYDYGGCFYTNLLKWRKKSLTRARK